MIPGKEFCVYKSFWNLLLSNKIELDKKFLTLDFSFWLQYYSGVTVTYEPTLLFFTNYKINNIWTRERHNVI